MYVQPELHLPPLGILALIAESNDVARVASSLNVSCATVRGIAVAGAQEMLGRYHRLIHSNASFVVPTSYTALIHDVQHVVRLDIMNVVAILTARERLEVFEAFAYFRAFCNSPVTESENLNYGQV